MRVDAGGGDDRQPPATERGGASPHGGGSHEHHAVHFYEDEAERLVLLNRFVDEGTRRGQRVVIIARASLCSALASLRRASLSAAGSGVVMLDGRQLVDRIMVDGRPHPARFQHEMNALLELDPSASGGRSTRIYGEMVEVLLEAGHHEAALALEELWSGFVAVRDLEVLCAYPMDRFATAADSAAFERICAVHGRVNPTERYQPDRSETERHRQVAVLQQRVRALEHELEARRASEQLIEDAEALRDDFMVVAGHELRTPLTVIQLQIEHLLRSAETDVPPRVQRALALTARGVDRLTMVVEQVLEVARIEGGRMTLQLAPVDLALVVRHAVARLPPAANGHPAVVLQLEDGLRGRWDLARVDRVVTTLLSNAVKFGRAFPIAVTVTRAGNFARLVVRDEGLGISLEDQNRIFARYVRSSASTTVGGLGLGLWIARAVVTAHGGTIGVHSTRGRGSSFIVELPLASSEGSA